MSETDSIPSITELLKSVDAGIQADDLFIMAGALNLYLDSMSKLAGRSLIGPEDMKHILQIWNLYRMVAAVENNVAQLSGAPQRKREPR